MLLAAIDWTSLFAGIGTAKGIGIIGLILIGGYLLYSNWSKIKPNLPVALGGGGGDNIPSRRQVIDNIDANVAYFQDIGCAEGVRLMSAALQHVFEEVHDVPATDTAVPSPSAINGLVTQLTEALRRTNHPAPPPVSTSPASTESPSNA